MSLLTAFCEILKEWIHPFSQPRVFRRALRQILASLCSVGRRTLTCAIQFMGRSQDDWAAEYRLHSQRTWEEPDLFLPHLRRCLEWTAGQAVMAIGLDDTQVKKTGRHIPMASWQRDPLSPPFHVNFQWGLRFLQASVLFPCYNEDPQAAPRGIPVRFTQAPVVKKPGKRASAQEKAEYKELKKTRTLSHKFVEVMGELRQTCDKLGYTKKKLLIVGDGSFCNRQSLRPSLPNVTVLVRARKDARLCHPAPENSGRRYSKEKFTPESVRQNDSIPWQTTSVFHGGCVRLVRYKAVTKVLWQRGTQTKPLLLIVVAPTPYRLTKKGKALYRDPAYLLCTEPLLSVPLALQSYFDRWQIEVNFREEKDTLGVGQAQVWCRPSVVKQPAFIVAGYSALLLAGQAVYGARRDQLPIPTPKWRRNAKRPSCADLVAVLRDQLLAESQLRAYFDFRIKPETSPLKAAA